MMTPLQDSIAIAVDTQNAKLAGKIADHLRARGMTYAQILAEVQCVRPDVTLGDWDALIYEAESEES
jgi:hypothetical protein